MRGDMMKRYIAVIGAGAILLILAGCTSELRSIQKVTATIVVSPTEGKAPLSVHFDASRSTDPGGAITDYLWDPGDGSSIVSGREIEHTFQRAGEYLVTLVVVGTSGTGRATAVVRALNNPPAASFTFLPSDPFNEEPIMFDASSSSDPDDDIARYTWDFGDGTPGEGRIATHTYAHPGEFVVVLTVTDSAGAEARATQLVKVEDCSTGSCGRRR